MWQSGVERFKLPVPLPGLPFSDHDELLSARTLSDSAAESRVRGIATSNLEIGSLTRSSESCIPQQSRLHCDSALAAATVTAAARLQGLLPPPPRGRPGRCPPTASGRAPAPGPAHWQAQGALTAENSGKLTDQFAKPIQTGIKHVLPSPLTVTPVT